MKKIIALCLIVLGFAAFAANAGRCDHSWQTAKDGSSCGGRAADMRPGGR